MENDYPSRYHTLSKLIDMLGLSDESNPVLKIPFTRLDIQSDPIEGVSNYSELMNIIKARDDYFKNVREDGGEIINEEKTTNLFKHPVDEKINTILKTRKTSFVSCWVNGKEENLPMWNLYAGFEGALITLKKKGLVQSLTESGVSEYKNVEYEKEVSTPEDAPFYKNNFYKYENEFRFVIRKNIDEKVIYKDVSIDMNLGLTISTHPQASNLIKKCYRKIASNDVLKIRDSLYTSDFISLKNFLEK